jgi:pimeloyl-[acyl-carrier protein] methyl ester esterase
VNQNVPVQRILILPGMDGTGKLLFDFMAALPDQMRREVSQYLTDVVLSYDQLANLVRSMCEDSVPFVLLAESFSTPLAIRIAAENPANLQGLILCAGFVRSPVRGVKCWLASMLAPALVSVPIPEAAIRSWLLGRDATSTLVSAAREAISSVKPAVLSARLRAVLACDVRPDLRKVKVPLLYLQARHDRLVSPRCLEEIRVIRPEIRVVVVDGPHFLLQREPGRTAKIVKDFLSSLP